MQDPLPPSEDLSLEGWIDYVLTRFHEGHRRDLGPLVERARAMEDAHPAFPAGLAAHLARTAEELELHMQKEEQVLFPMLRAGRGRMAMMPISMMREEHDEHGRNLDRLRELTGGFVAPAGAAADWTALYADLGALVDEVALHVQCENEIVFARAMSG